MNDWLAARLEETTSQWSPRGVSGRLAAKPAHSSHSAAVDAVCAVAGAAATAPQQKRASVWMCRGGWVDGAGSGKRQTAKSRDCGVWKTTGVETNKDFRVFGTSAWVIPSAMEALGGRRAGRRAPSVVRWLDRRTRWQSEPCPVGCIHRRKENEPALLSKRSHARGQ